MKNLQINQVKNGWIVRTGVVDFAYISNFSQIFVYHTIEELQAALPELLKDEKQDGKDILS